MRYPEERKFFSEECAEFYDYQSRPRSKTVELFRLFKTSRPDLRASGLEFLDKFVSTANSDSIEADTACEFVDSPKVSLGKTFFSGRWRLVGNKQFRDPTDSNVQGILQQLKLYWNTTVLTGATPNAIDWTRARVASYESSPGNTETFDGSTSVSANPAKLAIIEWTAVAPSAVATVVTEFAANFPATAFTVDGQAFPSGWAYIFAAVTDDKTDSDGTKIVRFVVGRPEFCLKYRGQLLSSAAFTGYVIWDLPKAIAQTVLDAVIAANPQGVSITPDYNSADHTVTLRMRLRDSLVGTGTVFNSGGTCMQTETNTVYSGYTLANLQVLLNALPATVASGVWYTVSGIKEDKEDGLWDCQVTKYTAVAVAQASHTTTTSQTGTETTARNFNTTDANVATTLPVVAASQGVLQRRALRKNSNCTTDVELATDTSTALSVGPTETGASSTNTESSTVTVNSQTAIAAPADSQGVVGRSNNSINPDGTYNGVAVTDTSVALSVGPTETGASSTNTESSTVTVNSRTAIAAPADSQGVVGRSNNSINPDGTYNGVAVTDTSVPASVSFASMKSSAAQQDNDVYRNSRSKFVAPEDSQGVVFDADNRINDDLTYDGRITKKTSYPMSVNFRSIRSGAEGRDIDTYRNLKNPLNASLSSQGRVFSAENNINDDYTYDGRLTEVYSYPREISFFSLRTNEQDVYDTEYKSKRSIVEAPKNTQGVIFNADISQNDDDTYSGKLRKRTAIPSVLSLTEDSTLLRSVTQVKIKNDVNEPLITSVSRGYRDIYSVDLNEDDTYDADCRSAFAWPDQVKFTSLVSPVGSVEISSYLNKQSPIDTGTITSINIGSYRVTNDENDDGTYDGDVVYSQPPAYARQVDFTSLHSPLLEREQTSYQFAREKIDAPPASIGHSYSVNNTLTDDGTYDQDLTYNLGVQHETPLMTVGLSDSLIDYEINGKNFTSIPEIVDESSDYKVVKMSIGVNELGAYDYVVNKTFVRDRPISSMATATWDIYDPGYVWQSWGGGVITGAQRRMNSHTIKYHRDEVSAIAEIQGGFSGSTHDKVSDFLWRSHRIDVTEWVWVYGGP